MGLLAELLARKNQESAELARKSAPLRPAEWPVRDVYATLKRSPGDRLRLIAEIKYRSPSAGELSRRLDPAGRAAAYQRAGATMVSVLTDAHGFDGAYAHLAAVRAAIARPLLCKDFVVGEAQVDWAFGSGADAVLVIVRCLAGNELARVVDAVRARGLEPFVEVANDAELDRALEVGARVVGVNARDLDTLVIDIARAARVLERIPADVAAIHLSGVHEPAQVRSLAASRADAALIGEALMRQDDPEPLLASLVAAT